MMPMQSWNNDEPDIYAFADDDPPPVRGTRSADGPQLGGGSTLPPMPAHNLHGPADHDVEPVPLPKPSVDGPLADLIVAWIAHMAAGETDGLREYMRVLSRRGDEVKQTLKMWSKNPINPPGLSHLPPPVVQTFYKQLASKMG